MSNRDDIIKNYYETIAIYEKHNLLTLDNVVGVLVNTGIWKPQLEHIPNRKFLNLSIVYMIADIWNGDKNAVKEAILIDDFVLSIMGVSEVDLYSAALLNTSPYVANTLEFLLSIEDRTLDDGLLIVTNKNRKFGAFVIADKNVLNNIHKRVGCNFYILPGSMDEVYILPEPQMRVLNHTKKVIDEVTHTLTSSDDYLTDSIYYYDHAEQSIKIVGEEPYGNCD